VKKIYSLLKKRVDLPSVKEARLIIHLLKPGEKMVFFVLSVVFIIGFTGVLWEINNMSSIEVPARGGTIYEGVVGIPRFINPLIAISDADRDIAALVYSGLLKSDGSGNLINDLSDHYEISEDGLEYSFTLKEGLEWHDGSPITTDDVAYTIKLVQTPSVKSLKRGNWEGVDILVVDEKIIKFFLKKPYAPFLENATLGILPKHIWGETMPEQLGLSEFNIKPVGSGPYFVKKVSRNSSGIINSYSLYSFDKYALGEPNINKIVINFYNSENDLLRAYENGNINSMGSISPKNLLALEKYGGNLQLISLPRIFGVFFNQNQNKVLADIGVRRALNIATDRERIVNEVLEGRAAVIYDPIPPGTMGAPTGENLNIIEYNPQEASEILDNTGWKINEETGIREKKTKQKTEILSISLSTSIAEDLVRTAGLLKEMWEQIGINVEVRIFEIGDFDKDVLKARDYDALLFGEVVGYDPDPFAFWHSSQRNDPGLNIALYANITADKLISDARKIIDSEERIEKYLDFQKEVRSDFPAVFIYSPYYLYIIPDNLMGVDTKNIITPSERFVRAHKWYTDTKKVWKIFVN